MMEADTGQVPLAGIGLGGGYRRRGTSDQSGTYWINRPPDHRPHKQTTSPHRQVRRNYRKVGVARDIFNSLFPCNGIGLMLQVYYSWAGAPEHPHFAHPSPHTTGHHGTHPVHSLRQRYNACPRVHVKVAVVRLAQGIQPILDRAILVAVGVGGRDTQHSRAGLCVTWDGLLVAL